MLISSNNEGKRRLINFVFSNLQLNGQKLQFSLRKPFDLYVKATNCGEWRSSSEAIAHQESWRGVIDAVRTLPEQRAAVIEFPKQRKIHIDSYFPKCAVGA